MEQIGRPELQIARQFFSDIEAAEIASRTDPKGKADIFYRLWTLKESFIKCVGRGLFIPLNEFSVLLDREPAGLLQSIDDSVYSLGEYDPGDGYKYAWCLKDPKNDSGLPESPVIVTIDA